MLEAILEIFMILEIFITLGLFLYICINIGETDKKRKTFVLSSLIKFLKKLFLNKNWFGITLGLVIFFLAIPAILLVLLGEILMWLIVLGAMLWDLGNKNTNWTDILFR